MIYVGSVTEVHLNSSGEVIFSVEDSSGTLYYPCLLTSPLSGAHGVFSVPSLRVGCRVIICGNPTDRGRSFYLLGGVPHRLDSEAISMDGVASALENERLEGRRTDNPDVMENREVYELNSDYSDVHIEDVHIEGEDNWMNLSIPHGMTLQGSPRVSIQMPQGEKAVFRVSVGGISSNGVYNALPFGTKLFNYLQTIVDKINALERSVKALTPATITSYETAAVTADTAAAAAATSGDLITANLQRQIARDQRDRSLELSTANNALESLGTLPQAQEILEDINTDINQYIKIP